MKEHKTLHTGAPRGKRVWVILRDGTKFADRFRERKDTVRRGTYQREQRYLERDVVASRDVEGDVGRL